MINDKVYSGLHLIKSNVLTFYLECDLPKWFQEIPSSFKGVLIIRSNSVVFKLGIAVDHLGHDWPSLEGLSDHYKPSVPPYLPRDANDFTSKPFKLIVVSQSA